MSKPKYKQLFIRTVGYNSADELIVDTGINACGTIRDGVGFCHRSDPTHGGNWVVSLRDLELIVEEAHARRATKK